MADAQISDGPRILVDADACPVKNEIVKVATRYQVPVTFVACGGLRPSRDPLVTTKIVAAGPDAADDWIAETARAGDLVITSDIPLAARALEKGAKALKPDGRPFTEETIGMALAVRQLNQDIREATQSQTRHRAYSARDRSDFLQALDQVLAKARREMAD